MPAASKPTPGELAILQILWRRGPSTVREVLAESGKGTGYTTILKLMQIMTEKGLLRRDQSSRTHIYRPATPQAQALRRLVGDLLDRTFEGSSKKLLLAMLSTRRASQRELQEMRQLIAEAEQEQRNTP